VHKLQNLIIMKHQYEIVVGTRFIPWWYLQLGMVTLWGGNFLGVMKPLFLQIKEQVEFVGEICLIYSLCSLYIVSLYGTFVSLLPLFSYSYRKGPKNLLSLFIPCSSVLQVYQGWTWNLSYCTMLSPYVLIDSKSLLTLAFSLSIIFSNFKGWKLYQINNNKRNNLMLFSFSFTLVYTILLFSLFLTKHVTSEMFYPSLFIVKFYI